MASPRVKVKLRFFDNRLWWRVSLTQYIFSVVFHSSPSVFSNFRHASMGRYIYGRVESMKVGIGFGSRFCRSVTRILESSVVVEEIDCSPTTRSREGSLALERDTLLGTNRERS